VYYCSQAIPVTRRPRILVRRTVKLFVELFNLGSGHPWTYPPQALGHVPEGQELESAGFMQSGGEFACIALTWLY
jgi:hypothetical protein